MQILFITDYVCPYCLVAKEALDQALEYLGLDPLGFTEALENGTYTAREKEAVEYSRNVLKPTGVPTIYIDGQKIMQSEYTKEEMVRILLGASAEGGMACGENGCG